MATRGPKISDTIHIPWRAVIFGGSLPDYDLTEFRTQQIERASRLTWAQLGMLLLTAAALIGMSWGHAPVEFMAGYALASIVTATARYATRFRRRIDWVDGDGTFAFREMALSSVTGMVMTAPMIYFAVVGDMQAARAAWIVTASGMTAYAFVSVAVPILFCGIMPLVGLVAVATLYWVGDYTIAASALLFSVVSLASVLSAGRDLVHFELLDRKAAERGETVSLLLREFEDAGADWLWQVDHNRRITKVSPRFAHAVSKEAAELEGMGFLQLLAGENWSKGRFPPALHDLANRLNRKESFAGLIVPVELDGRARWWELSASPIYGSDGAFQGFRGVGSDVTEQRTSADRIAHLARFDALTALPNRLNLNETLAGALEQAASWRRRCAFMMIDLDRFKAVNDTLGHPVGDRLLAHVAARIKQLCSDNVVAGRLGGDEFGVVLKEVEGTEAIDALGRRLIEVVSRPYEIDEHTLYVGASIGYAVGPRDGSTVEALTRNADLALYRSKDKGGGVVNGYEPSLHDQARERRDIEIELRSALSKNEFEVFYQPVVYADGTVDGFEALLRWTNAKLGSVSPVKFIPVAEDTRLIGPIGEWVLATACREAKNWPENTKVAVNVSAEQLSSPGFIGTVVKALSHSGLQPSRLELEVTESVFLRESSGAMTVLDQVRALGVKLVLDDFGTGYSSLGYLRMGQFSTIKVDRSFVQGALKGARESIAIIRAVVALAESLDMSTTAEGVESQPEADAIVALGCRKLQGYHFGRPMTATNARAIFADNTRQSNVA